MICMEIIKYLYVIKTELEQISRGRDYVHCLGMFWSMLDLLEHISIHLMQAN